MKKTNLEKFLAGVAKTSCKTTSSFILYEPEIPKKLLEKEQSVEEKIAVIRG